MICENLLKSLSSKLSRRRLLRLAAALPLLSKSTAVMAAQQSDKVVATQQRALSRIAFGSCAHQDKDQPIWSDIMGSQPELFVFLGDNIYGDSENPEVLAAKYAKLAAKPGFSSLRQQIEVIATWDDHDYGRNDAGRDYPSKEASRKLLLDFFGEPASSGARDQMESTLLTFMENQVKRCRLYCWTCAGTGAQLLASRIRSASKSALPKIVALTTYHCLPRQSFWVSGNGHGWNSSCRSKPMCELSEAASNYWLNLRAGKPGPISPKSASVSSSCWSATKLSP